MLNTTQQNIKDEIINELKDGDVTLDDIRDNSGEWIDGYLPVYNNRIIEEWQNMPSEYDDRGAQELGISEDAGIISRMTLDLYLYYSDLFNEVLDEVESESEEVNA